MEEIVKLDTAFCNQIERSALLELFKHKEYVVDFSMCGLKRAEYFAKRHVKVTKICASTMGPFEKIVNTLLTLDCTYVREVQLPMNKEQMINSVNTWASLIKSCTSLQTIDLSRLSQSLTSQTVKCLSIHCNSLVTFKVRCRSDIRENVLIKLISKNPSLRHLYLNSLGAKIVTNRTLQCILAHCKHIHVLHILVKKSVDFNIFIDIGIGLGERLMYLTVEELRGRDLILWTRNNSINDTVERHAHPSYNCTQNVAERFTKNNNNICAFLRPTDADYHNALKCVDC